MFVNVRSIGYILTYVELAPKLPLFIRHCSIEMSVLCLNTNSPIPIVIGITFGAPQRTYLVHVAVSIHTRHDIRQLRYEGGYVIRLVDQSIEFFIPHRHASPVRFHIFVAFQ